MHRCSWRQEIQRQVFCAVGNEGQAYKVYFARVPEAKETAIDHSSFIYLMDRDGKYLGFFPPGASAEQLVAVIRRNLEAPGRGQ